MLNVSVASVSEEFVTPSAISDTSVTKFDDNSDSNNTVKNGVEGVTIINEATKEDVPRNFAVLRALKRNAEYRIVETKNPKGHTGEIDYGFTFEEEMEIVLENLTPDISTTARDKATGMHLTNPKGGPVTLIDTVELHVS